MSARRWLAAVTGTAFLVFVLPYIRAVFGQAPNGTETLLLVVLLWTGSWVLARRRGLKSTDR